MKISIIAHPGSKRNLVKQEGDSYHVYTTAKPIDGEANTAIIALMADFLEVKKYQIRLVSGEKWKHKVLEVS